MSSIIELANISLDPAEATPAPNQFDPAHDIVFGWTTYLLVYLRRLDYGAAGIRIKKEGRTSQ